MRKYLYLLLIFIASMIIIGSIIIIFKNSISNEKVAMQEIENVYQDMSTVSTASEEEKLSANAVFALEKIYDDCNHFDYEEAELPVELVNLTRQEVEDYYNDWEVQEFSKNKLILCKNIEGYCDEHFVVKLDGDFINIYRLGRHGELLEYEKTDISRDYLPAEDIGKLEEGITIYGKGKLSSILEDYE